VARSPAAALDPQAPGFVFAQQQPGKQLVFTDVFATAMEHEVGIGTSNRPNRCAGGFFVDPLAAVMIIARLGQRQADQRCLRRQSAGSCEVRRGLRGAAASC